MRVYNAFNLVFISRILGSLFYSLFSRINTRFLLPSPLSDVFESARSLALVSQGAHLGEGSCIRSNVFIAYPQNIRIGKRAKIGDFSRIYNFSEFIVGDDTEIGPGLHVQTNEHDWVNLDQPLAKQGAHTRAVEVGPNSYLGANVTLLSGVSIGSSVVVAAGAVVTRDLESFSLYGGVPARKFRDLSSS